MLGVLVIYIVVYLTRQLRATFCLSALPESAKSGARGMPEGARGMPEGAKLTKLTGETTRKNAKSHV